MSFPVWVLAWAPLMDGISFQQTRCQTCMLWDHVNERDGTFYNWELAWRDMQMSKLCLDPSLQVSSSHKDVANMGWEPMLASLCAVPLLTLWRSFMSLRWFPTIWNCLLFLNCLVSENQPCGPWFYESAQVCLGGFFYFFIFLLSIPLQHILSKALKTH